MVQSKKNDGSKREGRNSGNHTSSSNNASSSSSSSSLSKRVRGNSLINNESPNLKRSRQGSSESIDDVLSDVEEAAPPIVSPAMMAVRETAIEKKLELIKQLLEQKEKDQCEILFLESGGNMVNYDPSLQKGKLLKEEVPETVMAPPLIVELPPKKGPGRPAKDPRKGVVSLKQQTPPSHQQFNTNKQQQSIITPPQTPQTPATPHPLTQTMSPIASSPSQLTSISPAPTSAPSSALVPSAATSGAKGRALPVITSLFATPPAISDNDRERAAKDAEILRRVGELQRDHLWSLKRLPKAPEPPRSKVHWDYILAEMAWLANDFKQERKWKAALAKKVSKQVMKYHHMQETREQRKVKEEEQQLRRVASGIAREVKKFWQKVEKVVEFKRQAVLDEKKKEALGKQMENLVVQTKRYTEMIAQDMKASTEEVPSKMEQEERGEKEEEKVEGVSDEVEEEGDADAESGREEAPSHTQELLMPKEDGEGEQMEEDAEFVPTEEPEADDEETLEEEEKKEDQADLPKGAEELSQLQRESEMPLEEVLLQFRPVEGEEEGEGDEAEEDEENDKEGSDGKTGKERISEAAASATEAQPTGFTLSTTKVKTKVPVLLRGTLREYQHIGLDWLVTMYEKRLNGILADEMGLGKTIMTIALLAHLAYERQIWGPHLIVVPTSVMLNWELEFKRWCPAFKILTYFGTQKERRQKRTGWSKTNSFHVCITSYKVVIQDQQAFRRKKWKYFILDEAHNIKNFRSQRWQVLLNFNSKRRLLLTGTPLQNNLMELWSLMHFLMPHMFQSHKEFKDWFSNPVTNMIEGTESLNEDLIARLHEVLRPFLLRRLKKDVEKQLPNKYHHVVTCQLSKRQRFLYEEFMSNVVTQETLKSGNFLGIINVLMQLRKVCNHPDLFEVRPIISPFDMEAIELYTSSTVCRALEEDSLASVSLSFLNLSTLASAELDTGHLHMMRTSELRTPSPKIVELSSSPPSSSPISINHTPSILEELHAARERVKYQARLDNLKHVAYINEFRCSKRPLYGWDMIRAVHTPQPVIDIHTLAHNHTKYLEYPDSLVDLVKLPGTRSRELSSVISEFVCIIPKARAPPTVLTCSHPDPSEVLQRRRRDAEFIEQASPAVDIFRNSFVRSQVYFPDKSLVQYDCGKLQQLDLLLRDLKKGGHRALIFTQMTRMLDILEIFLNLHGYTYLRLDGSTKIEKRQQLTERFNADPKVFIFILSTRSGGVGINLTGADSVIFYDSDWNPAMDAQAQDRCHRIGQTRDVHIYRLVTEHTIEENILKKANQKRHLDDMVIKGGGFTTEFFKNVDIRDLFDATKEQLDLESIPIQLKERPPLSQQDWEAAVANAEDETDAQALRLAKAEQSFEYEEFNEEVANQQDSFQPNGAPSAGVSEEGQDLAFLQQEDEPSHGINRPPSTFAFEDDLLPVQRYALHFLEVVVPVMDNDYSEVANSEQVDAQEQEMQLEDIKRLKEEEEDRMSDDDALFYEVVS